VDSVLRRIARLGDGWLPQAKPDADGKAVVERFRTYVAEAGRDPEKVGIDARVAVADGMSTAVQQAEAWNDMRLTYVGVNTMRAGFKSIDQHLDALREFKAAVG
jgi:alkanesulfonate monooxygenase SsuD/methylene tetrahydromethanopterin reductase-like flavin-dependent oxidoreductase (luciferase family)